MCYYDTMVAVGNVIYCPHYICTTLVSHGEKSTTYIRDKTSASAEDSSVSPQANWRGQ